MELYATHKIYKTSFGDFVPYIMSNALGLNFLIVPAQPIPDVFEQGVHLVTPLSDLPHHDTPVIVVKWGEHYDGCTPVVKLAWSYVLSLNTNDEKLPNSNFKVCEKLPAGALSDREETIHISSLADKVDTNMAHSLCSWTPADDVCVETNESSKGIDVTDCTVNQLHIDESQSDEPRDFLYEPQQHRKNNPKNLITGSLNINSIRNKFDTIQHMLQCRYIDIQIILSVNNNVNVCTGTFYEYLTTIIDLHCPLKTKTILHNNVSYMNAELRRLQYQRNMMRNLKNENPNPENFERYRILRNKCVKLRLSSQCKYFEQRCEGGPKNQHFWPTIKPFVNNKGKSNKDIILCGNDNIISHPNEVANIFNEYFTAIADEIGFDDPIPSGYENDDVLRAMIAKYDNHPSIITIKNSLSDGNFFAFTNVTVNEVYNMLMKMDCKKSTGFGDIPGKLLKMDQHLLSVQYVI